MSHLPEFDRLMESADLIARHAPYPGKFEVVEQCREDIEDLAQDGQITPEQRDQLIEILEGACLSTA